MTRLLLVLFFVGAAQALGVVFLAQWIHVALAVLFTSPFAIMVAPLLAAATWPEKLS